jgi:hypothetical protein
MLNWTRKEHKYGPPSDVGKLGRWTVFTISWRITSKEDKDNPYGLSSTLPGFKDNLGEFPTIEEAKQLAEKALVSWIEGAGL